MKIVLTPDWFVGSDVLIEIFSFIVLIIVAALSYKNYKLNKKNRNLLYLSWGFALIALAELATILTKLVLYYDIGPSQAIGAAIVTHQILSSVDIFYHLGFFFFRFLTLLGLYIIYRLPRDKRSIMDYVLVVYFIILSSIGEEGFYFIFHITALMILIATVEKYYWIYKKNKFVNTKVLMTAFSGLALAQLIFTISIFEVFFATANIIELISYAILLGLGVRILKHGPKKKPYGHNIGYAGDNSRKRREN